MRQKAGGRRQEGIGIKGRRGVGYSLELAE